MVPQQKYALLIISTHQLLTLWSELEQCYYGDNGYGGSTAEIYAYTLRRDRPTAKVDLGHMSKEAEIEEESLAREALFRVCQLFCEMRDCRISIDNMSLVSWRSRGRFTHRAHVHVTRKEGKGNGRTKKI